MTDQELVAFAKAAGFSSKRFLNHSHLIHFEIPQPRDFNELRAFYELAFERGKQEERKNSELPKLREPNYASERNQSDC